MNIYISRWGAFGYGVCTGLGVALAILIFAMSQA